MKNKKYLIAALVSIGILGQIAHSNIRGPEVTSAEIKQKNLYNSAVTIIGTVCGRELYGSEAGLWITDSRGEVIKFQHQKSCNGSKGGRTGFKYRFYGTALTDKIIMCGPLNNCIEATQESQQAYTERVWVYNGRRNGTEEHLDASNGWHTIKWYETSKGKTYPEVID